MITNNDPEAWERFRRAAAAHSGRSTPTQRAKCQLCQDVGWLRGNYPIDHPMFGKLIPCQCNAQKSGDEDANGLLHHDRVLAWDDLQEFGGGVGSQIDAAKSAVRSALARGWGWVFLWGGYGTGKTTLLKIAVVEALKAGSEAFYCRMADMSDEILAAYDAEKPFEDAIKRVRWWSHVPVLAVDEFEKTSGSKGAENRRFQVFDSRYQGAIRGQGVTLIASNVSPQALAKRPEYAAIADRLLDGRFAAIELSGKSFRPYAK